MRTRFITQGGQQQTLLPPFSFSGKIRHESDASGRSVERISTPPKHWDGSRERRRAFAKAKAGKKRKFSHIFWHPLFFMKVGHAMFNFF